jgi:hypothetical protein
VRVRDKNRANYREVSDEIPFKDLAFGPSRSLKPVPGLQRGKAYLETIADLFGLNDLNGWAH